MNKKRHRKNPVDVCRISKHPEGGYVWTCFEPTGRVKAKSHVRYYTPAEAKMGANQYARIVNTYLASKGYLQNPSGSRVKVSPESAGIYRIFTGYNGIPDKVKKISSPKDLICIAQGETITYYSDKINGGGTGKREAFKHRFGARIKIYTDPKGSFLLIAGPGLKVRASGING